jgi:hypothetical protein
VVDICSILCYNITILNNKGAAMTLEEIQNQIDELEEALGEEEFGSSGYDFLTAEVEYLYLKRDKIGKKRG